MKVVEFMLELSARLPATETLLRSANLVLHPSVSRVILHGSRGPAGGYRPDSDIDLSLIVDLPEDLLQTDRERLLQDVVETTLQHWQAVIELDLAVIFDLRRCELKCFDQTRWDEQFCALGGTDCFGLYKVQKGFTGLVTNAGIEVKRMYPCLTIWQRDWAAAVADEGRMGDEVSTNASPPE